MTGHAAEVSALRARQADRFGALVAEVLAGNPFYRAKYASLGHDARRPPALADLEALPLTTKAELVADQAANPPFGSDLTYPIQRYTRLHQTSGTTGAPLRWLDTADSWRWFVDTWSDVLHGAGVTAGDRVFVAFSFGPFIGFWGGFEAAQAIGAMALSGGGQDSRQRLAAIRDHGATVLLSTPTYAQRLAEVAAQHGIDLRETAVRVGIQAGEPGASLPNVCARIEAAWGMRCLDHAGATELGAWGFPCGVPGHMHVNEEQFVAEVVDPETAAVVAAGGGDRVVRGELVLTNLGRTGSPLLRYRTGDLVALCRAPCPCGRPSAYLVGGVLGRADGMIVIRGVNVFPSAIENLVREQREIDEFEARVARERAMAELVLRIEVGSGDAERVRRRLADRLREALQIRAEVVLVEPGSLPRYELKARRFRLDDDAPRAAPP